MLGFLAIGCTSNTSGLDPSNVDVVLPDATLSLSPTAQSFGKVAPGASSATFKFTLFNIGAAASGPVALSVDGADSDDFQIFSSTCGAPLTHGQTCEVGMVLSPATAAATKNARLVLKSSPGGIAAAALTGIAQAPAAAILSPSQFDFGPLLAASATSAALPSTPAKATFMLANTGGLPIGPFTVDVGGKDATDFTVTDSSTCTSALALNAACTITVSFRPALPGSKTATLTATSSDGALKLAATLVGVGTDTAMLALMPSTLAFGSVPVGMHSAATISIQNPGGAATGTVAYTLTGVNFSEFSVDSSNCAMLPPGATCSLTVTFSPSQPGAKAASLRADAAPGGSASADITATAISPSSLEMLSVTAAAMDPFGTVPLGQASSAVFVVQNKGVAAAGRINGSIGGTNFVDFAVTDNSCPMSLDAGGSCSITVSFLPLGTGTRTGNLQVAAMPGGFASLALTAIAVDGATLGLSLNTKSFGTLGVNAGDSAPTTFTVTNTGATSSGPLAVALEGTDATSFNISFSDCPLAALASGKTCHVDVRFNPATTGNKVASLSVTATPGGVARASLYGTGN
ncbi:MAG TPA: choice-of-anchor D domain-containing protein [Polyangia bacterium]|jgi:hypothetical protein